MAYSSMLAYVSTISIELIKPSSPTPPSHRIHKLSLIEQSITHTYMPIGLFYSKKQLGDEISNDPTQLSPLLARSLSKNLVLYYPYAGTLRDNAFIECDDSGAKLLHVSINRPMLEILNHPISDVKDLIFPRGLPWADDSPHGLAVAQLSYFSCGGIAISVCLSHKIGDACTAYQFLNDWASIARRMHAYSAKPALTMKPHFVQDSIFPSPIDGLVLSPLFGTPLDGCIQKRFIFSASKVHVLKRYVAKKSGVKNPTRTEVITAIVFKSAVTAAKVKSGSLPKFTLTQYTDLRERITPKLPSKSIGNLLSKFSVTIDEEGDMNLANIVCLMRNEKELLYTRDFLKDSTSEIVELLGEGGEPSYMSDNHEYTFSSILHPFHEIDFGWGGHGRLTTANGPTTKAIFIVDHGSELEVFVTLDQEQMFLFERNIELLKFAYPVQGIRHLALL